MARERKQGSIFLGIVLDPKHQAHHMVCHPGLNFHFILSFFPYHWCLSSGKMMELRSPSHLQEVLSLILGSLSDALWYDDEMGFRVQR